MVVACYLFIIAGIYMIYERQQQKRKQELYAFLFDKYKQERISIARAARRNKNDI